MYRAGWNKMSFHFHIVVCIVIILLKKYRLIIMYYHLHLRKLEFDLISFELIFYLIYFCTIQSSQCWPQQVVNIYVSIVKKISNSDWLCIETSSSDILQRINLLTRLWIILQYFTGKGNEKGSEIFCSRWGKYFLSV